MRRHRAIARFRVLLLRELTDLARDRKVICIAILLPALLFPVLMSFAGKLFRNAERTAVAHTVRIGVVGESAVLDRLVGLVDHATWARGGSKQEIRNGVLDALVLVGRTAGGPERYTLLFDQSRGRSLAARDRVVHALDIMLASERGRLLARAGAGDIVLPARDVAVVDLATGDSRSTSTIARFLPMLLVLILLSAAAFAAIDLFPGERERGTLETLLTQPIDPIEVLAAKYVSVFLVGIVAISANLVGLLIASLVADGTDAESLSFLTVSALFAFSLPLCLLLSAFLVRVVARARSVREGQSYLLPLTLLCLLPPFMAGSPDVPFDAWTASLPLAGPAIAFRELSCGRVDALPLAMAVLTTLIYSACVLVGTVKHLSSEQHLLDDGDGGGEGAGRAVVVVLGSILGLYAIGPFLQGYPPCIALGVPLVLFTGLPPLVFGRWAGMSVRRLLAFRRPTPRCVIVSVCAGGGLAILAPTIVALQEGIVPMPQAFREAADAVLGGTTLPFPLLLLLLAVMPGIFEELFYRRFLLETMLRRTDVPKALLITSALFALHHLSIFRVLPTFAAGLVLGWLVLRTHSFWTAPIAHAISNGLVLTLSYEGSPLADTEVAAVFANDDLPLLRIGTALGLIFLPRLVLYRRQNWQPKARTA